MGGRSHHALTGAPRSRPPAPDASSHNRRRTREEPVQALATKLGTEFFDFEQFFLTIAVPHLELPLITTNFLDIEHYAAALIVACARNLAKRSLWFGQDHLPRQFDAERLHEFLRSEKEYQERVVDTAPAPLSISHLELLSMPFLVFTPTNFLHLLNPSSNAPISHPSLRHLEVTLLIRNTEQDQPALASLFELLRPTLSYLSLRIVFADGIKRHAQKISRTVCDGLRTCRRLYHFALGGMIDEVILPELAGLPSLEHLVLLPVMDNSFDVGSIRSRLGRFRRPLRSLTVCSAFGWRLNSENAPLYLKAVRECAATGVVFREEKRIDESMWLRTFQA